MASAQRLLARRSLGPTLPRTLTIEWQCEWHCHSAPNVPPRVSGTATRPRTYSLGTLDVEWQCETHCHLALNVQSRAFTAT